MVVIVTFLSACMAGKTHYNTGMQIYQAGNYTEAIAYLEEAIKQEPSNREYARALAEIKEKLILQHVQNATQRLESSDPITISAINNAKAKLAEAKAVNSGHPAVQRLDGKIQGEYGKLVSEVKKLYTQAGQYIRDKEYLKANFNLQQVQSLFPNYENTVGLLNRTVTEGVEYYVNRAKTRYDGDDFKSAKDYSRKAVTLKADDQAARELLARAEENDTRAYFVRKATKAASGKNWDAAVVAYERALSYDPDNDDLKNLIRDVTSSAGTYYIQQAGEWIQNGWLMKAFNSYRLAEKYVDSAQEYQLSGLRRKWTSNAANVAQNFRNMSQYGAAWYLYLKIQAIEPGYPEIFRHIQAMEDQIQNRSKKSIAVFDFLSPSDYADAGILFANNLITYLFKNASSDIKILERENLKSIMEEMKLGQMGIVSEQSAKEMGRVYGIDVAIMGSVLLFKVDSSMSKSSKTVTYQTGMRIEDNIEYLNWKAKHPNPTEQQLATAPAAKIKVPQNVEKEYNITNHRKVGFVQLSFRIVDVATGENIQVKTIERKEVVEDQASAGVAEAGIKFDALEIPTDTELLQKLTREVVAELGLEVLRPLQNLEKTYYQNGDNLYRRRDELKAAENFANAVMLEKMKMIQGSPITKTAFLKLDEIFINHKTNL